MTSFHGGPADKRTLMLRRCPLYLRVVQDRQEFDALDRINDEPTIGETLSAYKRRDGAKVNAIHLNMGRGKGGWYCRADYDFCERQPPDEIMRSNEKWQAWCHEEYARFLKSAA